MKFTALIALLGLTSAQHILNEDLTSDLLEVTGNNFETSLLDIPQAVQANAKTLEQTVAKIGDLENLWLFNAKSRQYLAKHPQIARESKQLGFDISGFIKDVEVMCTGAIDNMERVKGKLVLRMKYGDRLKAKPSADIKIFNYVYSTWVSDLKFWQGHLAAVLKELNTIHTGALKVQSEFQKIIVSEENKIKHNMASVQKSIQHLQAQIKAKNCGLFQAETTFTKNCVEARKLRIHENKLMSQMFQANEPHRDGLMYVLDQGEEVVKFASLLKVDQTSFSTNAGKKPSFTEKEMGDFEARGAVAASLTKEMNSLTMDLQKVIKEMRATKAALDKKLIWG